MNEPTALKLCSVFITLAEDKLKLLKETDLPRLKYDGICLNLDVNRLAPHNRLKIIREFFNHPTTIPMLRSVAVLYLRYALKYDTDRVIEYIKFARNRDVHFCWHQLEHREPSWKHSETLRKQYNSELILTGMPPYLEEVTPTEGGTCVCYEESADKDTGKRSYSLVQCVAMHLLNPTNISITGVKPTRIAEEIQDLLDWEVPIKTFSGAYYPIYHLPDAIRRHFPNDPMADHAVALLEGAFSPSEKTSEAEIKATHEQLSEVRSGSFFW